MADQSSVVANVHYGGEYRAELERAAETGRCIFCELGFRAKALHRIGNWMIVPCAYPIRDRQGNPAAKHFLIVSYTHLNDVHRPDPLDWGHIGAMYEWAKTNLEIHGAGLCIRLGEPEICGRTIRHPHAHVIVPNLEPDPENPEKMRPVPIDFPIG